MRVGGCGDQKSGFRLPHVCQESWAKQFIIFHISPNGREIKKVILFDAAIIQESKFQAKFAAIFSLNVCT